MLIDKFTVFAQIINFLILVVLLRIFLFNRIVAAMTAREERIATRLRDAEERERQAEAARRQADADRSGFAAERDSRLKGLENEIAKAKDKLLAEVRQEVETRREQWRQAAADEREQFLVELRRRNTANLQGALRAALDDVAGAELEEQIAARFIRMMGAVDPTVREQMTAAAKRAGLHLCSSFPMTDTNRETVLQAVEAALGIKPEPEIEIDSQLICGIECRAGGVALGWSLETWLARFDQDIDAFLKGENDGPATDSDRRDPDDDQA